MTILGLMMAGVLTSGMMIGARLAGMKGWEETCGNSASSHSLGSFDLVATSSQKTV